MGASITACLKGTLPHKSALYLRTAVRSLIWRADVTSTVVAFGWMTDVQLLCVAMAVGATVGLAVLRRRGMRPVRPEPPALRAVRP